MIVGLRRRTAHVHRHLLPVTPRGQGASLRTLLRRASYGGRKARRGLARAKRVFRRYWLGALEPEILARAGEQLAPERLSGPFGKHEVMQACVCACLGADGERMRALPRIVGALLEGRSAPRVTSAGRRARRPLS